MRYIYLTISKCIDYNCYTRISDLKGEMLTVFICLHLSFLFYTGLGLVLNEPKVARIARNFLKRIFKKKRSGKTRVHESAIYG